MKIVIQSKFDEIHVKFCENWEELHENSKNIFDFVVHHLKYWNSRTGLEINAQTFSSNLNPIKVKQCSLDRYYFKYI